MPAIDDPNVGIMQTPTENTRRLILACLALLAIGGGTVVCEYLVATKPSPPKHDFFERTLSVAAVPVVATVAESPIIGHGTVRPKHEIKIVPQVSGKLVAVNERLAPGKVIPEGELLFEIDSTVYEARVRQAEAELRQLEAAIERTDQETASLDERIANAERMLAIDEEDHRTSKRLFEEEQVGTQRDVDLVYLNYLRQNDALIELRSRRSVMPHLRMETLAQIDAAKARLAGARHDLESTKIFCPFKARVELVAAYESQVVTAHFSIATLTDMSAFEITVGIDPRELRWLDEAIRPEALERGVSEDAPLVTVSWTLQGQQYDWRGHVTRFEKVDEATRTARLVVEVRDVDMTASVSQGNGVEPPILSLGMHCRAALPAAPVEGALLVPRHAVYENRWVYVFEPGDGDAASEVGHLRRREVPLLRSVGDSVLVDFAGREGTQPCELTSGAMLVVSPLIKPVDGMAVRLRDDDVASAARSPVREDAATIVAAKRVARTPVLAQSAVPSGGG